MRFQKIWASCPNLPVLSSKQNVSLSLHPFQPHLSSIKPAIIILNRIVAWVCTHFKHIYPVFKISYYHTENVLWQSNAMFGVWIHSNHVIIMRLDNYLVNRQNNNSVILEKLHLVMTRVEGHGRVDSHSWRGLGLTDVGEHVREGQCSALLRTRHGDEFAAPDVKNTVHISL